MPEYYLKVSKPDDKYCTGCPSLAVGYCMALDRTVTHGLDLLPTPPNCPLVKVEDLSCYEWVSRMKPLESDIANAVNANFNKLLMEEKQQISCEDKEPDPFCFCPRCDAERQRIGQIIAKHMGSKE